MMSQYFLVILVFVFTDVVAMRMSQQGRLNAQYYWNKKSEELKQQQQNNELKQQMQEERDDFFARMQNDNNFVAFKEHLKETVLAQGWFQGPSKRWKDKAVVLAFELLEPYTGYDFGALHSYIKLHTCKAISDYDKKCYFHLYDPYVCNEIITDVDQLLKYAASGTRIQPTFGNKLFFGRVLEKQNYYEQLLQEINKRK